MNVWSVVAASGGFGAEIVETVLAAGHSVVATARHRDPVKAAAAIVEIASAAVCRRGARGVARPVGVDLITTTL
jgi:NAD(P)-dependent dehydrogenase (short-subunit alcohol dehydrogenase family)